MGVITHTGYELDTIKEWTGPWEADAIPVDLATTTPVTLARIVTATLTEGDLLRIHAWARVTNDVGYTTGIGWYLKGYEYTAPGVMNPIFPVGALNGQNVTPNGLMHHMPLASTILYRVPPELDGKRIVVSFRVDAHSTAWEAGDTITVDQGYGQFWVEHLRSVL